MASDSRRMSLLVLVRSLLALGRKRAYEEAERQGWPLPPALRVHLWLRALGLSGRHGGDPPAGGKNGAGGTQAPR